MREEPLLVNIRDLGVVAALVTHGFEIKEKYRDPDGRMYFVFQETAALVRVVNNYYADTLLVKARKYFDDVKMLKSHIYSKS